MGNRNFQALLACQWSEGKFVCVGLDPDIKKLPKHLSRDDLFEALFEFNKAIVLATYDIVCAYKPNYAFYEAYGLDGIRALTRTVQFIHDVAPAVLVIIDAKRGDIGNTNTFTAEGIFDVIGGDALTGHPYLGGVALKPFLDRTDKGNFILCRTSNEGAGEFQDLIIEVPPHGFDEIAQGVLLSQENFVIPKKMLLYEYVAYRVNYVWNRGRKNCGLVAGATYPDEIKKVRSAAPRLPLLIPGIGTQGGDLEAAVRNGRNSEGTGFIINSSSGIIFAEDPRAKTMELDSAIRAIV